MDIFEAAEGEDEVQEMAGMTKEQKLAREKTQFLFQLGIGSKPQSTREQIFAKRI